MQYEIALPADYDMGIIRHRVATRGSMTDDFPGLGIKAYLVRERGQDGSPVNLYAPFYVWAATSGMDQFLFGRPFDGIRTDFGRPRVRTWQTVAYFSGSTPTDTPLAATREVRPIDPADFLGDVVDGAVDLAARVKDEPAVNGIVLGIDPGSWELVRLTLWNTDAPADVPGDRYRVLHLSEPHRHSLPTGRAW